MTYIMPLTEKIALGSDKSVTFNKISIKFGDGYQQDSVKGINSIVSSWSVTWSTLTDNEAEILENFLQSTLGVQKILWTPPKSSQPVFVLLDSYTKTIQSQVTNFNSISATFTRIFTAEDSLTVFSPTIVLEFKFNDAYGSFSLIETTGKAYENISARINNPSNPTKTLLDISGNKSSVDFTGRHDVELVGSASVGDRSYIGIGSDPNTYVNIPSGPYLKNSSDFELPGDFKLKYDVNLSNANSTELSKGLSLRLGLSDYIKVLYKRKSFITKNPTITHCYEFGTTLSYMGLSEHYGAFLLPELGSPNILTNWFTSSISRVGTKLTIRPFEPSYAQSTSSSGFTFGALLFNPVIGLFIGETTADINNFGYITNFNLTKNSVQVFNVFPSEIDSTGRHTITAFPGSNGTVSGGVFVGYTSVGTIGGCPGSKIVTGSAIGYYGIDTSTHTSDFDFNGDFNLSFTLEATPQAWELISLTNCYTSLDVEYATFHWSLIRKVDSFTIFQVLFDNGSITILAESLNPTASASSVHRADEVGSITAPTIPLYEELTTWFRLKTTIIEGSKTIEFLTDYYIKGGYPINVSLSRTNGIYAFDVVDSTFIFDAGYIPVVPRVGELKFNTGITTTIGLASGVKNIHWEGKYSIPYLEIDSEKACFFSGSGYPIIFPYHDDFATTAFSEFTIDFKFLIPANATYIATSSGIKKFVFWSHTPSVTQDIYAAFSEGDRTHFYLNYSYSSGPTDQIYSFDTWYEIRFVRYNDAGVMKARLYVNKTSVLGPYPYAIYGNNNTPVYIGSGPPEYTDGIVDGPSNTGFYGLMSNFKWEKVALSTGDSYV